VVMGAYCISAVKAICELTRDGIVKNDPHTNTSVSTSETGKM
jgi:hypothetical protein